MINKAYTAFFSKLEKNNTREWFEQHRAAYERDVQQPFYALLAELLPHVRALDPDIDMQPQAAVFRLHRDLRFAKDKTPYHTMMKAGFARGGRKSPWAGYYLGIDARHLHVGGGVFSVAPKELKLLRAHIAQNVDEWNSLLRESRFAEHFGGILGEKLQRPPAEFRSAFVHCPHVAYKQFYYMNSLNIAELFEPEALLACIVGHFRICTPLNTFLKKALC